MDHVEKALNLFTSRLARQRAGEVEAKAVDVHLLHPKRRLSISSWMTRGFSMFSVFRSR